MEQRTKVCSRCSKDFIPHHSQQARCQPCRTNPRPCACGCGELIEATNPGIFRRFRPGHARGEFIGAWKGGRVNFNGYVLQRAPGHPHPNHNAGYVFEHRLVMEKHLGRFLRPGEIVHHIDEDRANNAIENLRLMEKREHDRLHSSKRIGVKRRGASSKYLGVSWYKQSGKWRAGYSRPKKRMWKTLGYFDSETDAARAYDAFVREEDGPDAPANFPA